MKDKETINMTKEIYPLLLQPIYKDYLWGGSRIPEKFNRDLKPGIYAESWEVSDRPEGMSIITNGKHKDQSLQELIAVLGSDLIGTVAETEVFPLLIKLIDAKQRLSVQVHPNDKQAAKYGGEAKTEMWYVLDAEPESKVFAGLTSGTNKKTFEEALENEQLENVLQSIKAIPGECIYIPGGLVHAIGEGCLLLEIQQNSNTTYRVYDWGRVDTNGLPRELHVKNAMQVINWRDKPTAGQKPKRIESDNANIKWEILDCPFFKIKRFDLNETEIIKYDNSSFHALFTIKGTLAIEGNGTVIHSTQGMSCLLPAALDEYTLIPLTDDTSIIQISMT